MNGIIHEEVAEYLENSSANLDVVGLCRRIRNNHEIVQEQHTHVKVNFCPGSILFIIMKVSLTGSVC